MLKLRKIAITGGIACGKSSVTKILKKLGAFVVSADEIVHNLLSHDASTISQVIDLLGPEVEKNGSIDRKLAGEKVFRDPDTLLALEQIIHPKVRKAIQSQSLQAIGSPLFVAEIPLYYEGLKGKEDFFDKIVVVAAPEADCIGRWEKGEEDYRRRSKRLIPLKEKIARADYVITNDAGLDHLEKQVTTLYQQLRKPL